MKAYIFCPSYFLNKERLAKEIEISAENLYIAADSGIKTADDLSIALSLVIGDFDSAEKSLLNSDAYKDIEKLRHPPEKDDTDLMLAIKYALENSYKNIIIIGGMDGRTDHTIANLFLLKYIKSMGGTGYITNGYNRVRYISNSNSTECIARDYKYISILPMRPEVHGLTLRNFKYPLSNATITMLEPYTVSNEILPDKQYGEVEILDGDILICECEDIKIKGI